MTKRLSVSDATYARLRRSRRPEESFSRAIDRLLDQEKVDPIEAMARMPKPRLTHEEWRRQVEADRDNTRTEA